MLVQHIVDTTEIRANKCLNCDLRDIVWSWNYAWMSLSRNKPLNIYYGFLNIQNLKW